MRFTLIKKAVLYAANEKVETAAIITIICNKGELPNLIS